MKDVGPRTCRFCAEEVKPAAKVCPWCRQWLSVYSLRNPTACAAVLGVFVLVLLILCLAFISRVFNQGPDFGKYQSGISVVESKMFFNNSSDNPSVYIVGLLTNRTDIGWRYIQFDVRFYDQAGDLIDTLDDYHYRTVQPFGDSAFRVTDTPPTHPLRDYNSYKISVQYARDARTFPFY